MEQIDDFLSILIVFARFYCIFVGLARNWAPLEAGHGAIHLVGMDIA
jgi:hypothetical protein